MSGYEYKMNINGYEYGTGSRVDMVWNKCGADKVW